jgi:hypothetical protein
MRIGSRSNDKIGTRRGIHTVTSSPSTTLSTAYPFIPLDSLGPLYHRIIIIIIIKSGGNVRVLSWVRKGPYEAIPGFRITAKITQGRSAVRYLARDGGQRAGCGQDI